MRISDWSSDVCSSDLNSSTIELPIRSRRIRPLAVEVLAVAQATAQELRPFRHGDLRLDPLREQAPEPRMVPAKLVQAAVAMLADAGTKALRLIDQPVAIHFEQIVVGIGHTTSSIMQRPSVGVEDALVHHFAQGRVREDGVHKDRKSVV